MIVLDRSTLMVVFALMTLTMLVLFYFDTYRKSRAPFAGWWCSAVAAFFLGAVLYFTGEVKALSWAPTWAPSLGNGVMVLGAGCVRAASRSLAGRRVRPWLLWIPAAAALAVDASVRNTANARLGSIALLALMGTAIGLASLELWREREESWHLVRSLAITTAGCAFYYLSRTVGLAVLGPADPLFQVLFGTGVTLLMAMVLLVVASSSVTALNYARRTEGLQELAYRDGLTGLLNREAFMRQAQLRLRANTAAGVDTVIVMADLDHFKTINDRFGHGAGDGVIRAFAEACRQAVRDADLVGRYGGEEFALLLNGIDATGGIRIADRINAALADHSSLPAGAAAPTASFGIVYSLDRNAGLQRLLRDADRALYEAKAAGRNQAVAGFAAAEHGPFNG